ncbi:BatD family protein (plasmid) [Paracoccus methylovorus]|uniref:BatD family protein n=1 Tax=Paracoccus methylovorus TaxID=2812658 RepID=A0ABX7JJ51_9RHOB|nr:MULTISPECIES: BatD family protein [Paracoccus]QRZ14276.1 BatD family protein [Paracoccus methylovorus]
MVIRLLCLLLWAALPARADTLRLIVPDMRPVVGEMIPVTIRGEYTGPITLEKMTFPDSPAYDWTQVARDRWADERVDGKLFRIFERRVAVFPRQPGTLTIGPVTHHLTKAQGMTRNTVEVTAQPATWTVAPYPGSGRPLASSHVTVKDEFSTDPSRLGPSETFTRRITLTADGTMAHLLPPRPLIREPWLISFAAPEVRETRLTAQGPVAVAIWEWSMRPHTGEVGSLTPIQFPWFNTQIREMRGAVTLPVEIGIAGFGDNIGGTPGALRRVVMQGAAFALAGLVLGLIVALPGRALAPRRLTARLRGMLPNPKRRALRDAAKTGDLMALRGAAEAFIRAENRLGRNPDPAPLRALDEALFSGTPPGEFDRNDFLRRLTARRQAAKTFSHRDPA